MRCKLACDIAYVGYANQQANIYFTREMPIKQEVSKTSELVQSWPPPTPTLEAEKRIASQKKRKTKRECDVAAKFSF